jgi:hypothetical protein
MTFYESLKRSTGEEFETSPVISACCRDSGSGNIMGSAGVGVPVQTARKGMVLLRVDASQCELMILTMAMCLTWVRAGIVIGEVGGGSVPFVYVGGGE